MKYESFAKNGFEVVKASNIEKLNEIKNIIFSKSIETLKKNNLKSPDDFFNNFHKLNLKGHALNNFRMDIIKTLKEKDTLKLIFEAYEETILGLIGPDILVQKSCNLVIQQPNDKDYVLTHQDAPVNSPFEIVLWVPLVNIFNTKGMYILDSKKSRIANDILKEKKEHSYFQDYSEKNAEFSNINYGSSLVFWTGLIHGCLMNKEDETRWTLNIRFKSLYSPCGHKDPLEFFRVLKMSPLSQIALKSQEVDLI
ncbi:hypothetical protein OAK75_00085 [Bacteriovoracales bacterium]|nr:hypothetical protein [Bacteriovoracales bacterium]